MPIREAHKILSLYPSLSILDRMKMLARIVFCVKPIVAVLEKYLPERGLIVDLGCGYGIISHLLVKQNPGRNVVGVDTSSHRIQVARSSDGNNANLRFSEEDIRDFHFPTCDAIVIVDTLYLLSYQDQKRVINHCYENLRDGGVLIIKDNYRSRSWRYFYTHAEEKIKTKLGVYGRESKDNTLYYWRIENLLECLRNTGFQVEVITSKSFLPYPGVSYVCKKKDK